MSPRSAGSDGRAVPVQAAGAALAAALLALVGCGRDPRVESRGAVTYAGKPVERGSIGFFAADGHSEGAAIEAGRYVLRSLPGRYRVEIRGAREIKNLKVQPEMGPVYEDYIPAEHNSASTLTVEVEPGGPNELSFDLTAPGR